VIIDAVFMGAIRIRRPKTKATMPLIPKATLTPLLKEFTCVVIFCLFMPNAPMLGVWLLYGLATSYEFKRCPIVMGRSAAMAPAVVWNGQDSRTINHLNPRKIRTWNSIGFPEFRFNLFDDHEKHYMTRIFS